MGVLPYSGIGPVGGGGEGVAGVMAGLIRPPEPGAAEGGGGFGNCFRAIVAVAKFTKQMIRNFRIYRPAAFRAGPIR